MVMNGWARMKTTQKIAAITLIVLLGAVAYGFLRTGQPANTTAPKGAKGLQTALVDQSPMRTAQKLARLADTPDEQALSREAIRLADHEMDLAYESARRNAEAHPPVLSPEAKNIQARLEKAQELQKADQALAEQLKAEEAKASGNKKDALGDRLEEVKAQLESDEDEVDDATQDLIQAGGDAKGRAEQIGRQGRHRTTIQPAAQVAAYRHVGA